MKTLRERAIPTMTEMRVHIPTPDGKGIAKTIMVTVKSLTDPRTGEVYLSGDALEDMDSVKARYLGVLLPSEIKTMRERLGLTQHQMSELLSTDEKTYPRWENGRERPSESMNRLLVALWEGRLNLADLRAMQQPSYPWYEHISGPCPCGSENRSRMIETSPPVEEALNEACSLAA